MDDKRYPSDISREQFEKIKPILKLARKRTKPRTVDLYDVYCGILYILKGGCQWRQLPKDYSKWRTVHKYFLIWSHKPFLDQVLKKSSEARTTEQRKK